MAAKLTFAQSLADWWSRRTLAQRFTMLTAGLIAGSAILQATVLIGVASRVVSDLASARVEQRLEKVANQLANGIEEHRRLPLILSSSAPVPRIAALSTGARSLPGESLDTWVERLTHIAGSLQEANPSLLQVRLIGIADGGREIVRVERVGQSIVAVGKDKLQRTGDRPYFRETIKLRAGEVYLSPIDADVENGVVVRPFRPVLRAATPVFAEKGELFGIVVVSADVSAWINRIGEISGMSNRFCVANQYKDYIYRSDGKPVLGSEGGAPGLFTRDMPQAERLFDPSGPPALNFARSDVFVAVRRVGYDPIDPSKFIVVASDSDPKTVFGDKSKLNLIGTVLALIMAAIGIAAAYLVTRPLKSLMSAAREIAAGKLDVEELDKKARGADIGELGQALRIMKEAVATRETSLRRSKAYLDAVIDNTIDGLITIDRRGIIQRYNRGCMDIFGYTPEEAIGKNVSILMPSPDAEKHDGYLEQYARTGKRRFIGVRREAVGRHKDGHLVDIEVAIAEIKVGDDVLFSGVITDITQRKRIDKLKDAFVSSVTHELRTPLTSIMGSIGLLRSGALGTLPVKAAQMINLAHNNGIRLVSLINDILDFDRIEGGRVAFRHGEESVRSLVLGCIKESAESARKNEVSVRVQEIDEGLVIETDEAYFKRILGNILSNAIKFSPRGGEVKVAAGLKGENIRVSVEDNGPGIPEHFRSQVFQKFAQADASDTREKGGTGLGLNIAKALVERLGGSIGFETEVGKGTIFHFELPARHGRRDDSGENTAIGTQHDPPAMKRSA